jgi:hypothetical protein
MTTSATQGSAALGRHNAKEAVPGNPLNDLLLENGGDDDFSGDHRHGRREEGDEKSGLHDG